MHNMLSLYARLHRFWLVVLQLSKLTCSYQHLMVVDGETYQLKFVSTARMMGGLEEIVFAIIH